MTISDSTVFVVPCYNEAHRLRLEAYGHYLCDHPGINIIFVDDGSEDDTLARLNELLHSMPDQVRVMSLDINSGKAKAVRQGMLRAIADEYMRIGYWDADLSTPLQEIDSLVASLKASNADAVLGSRVKLLGKHIERHLYRHLAGRVFATMASMILDLPVYDTQCGAKVFSNNAYFRTVLSDPFISGWSFDVEILMRYKTLYDLAGTDFNIMEYPLGNWVDIEGSKVGPGDFVLAIFDLLRIRAHYRQSSVIDSYRHKLESI